MMDEEQHRARLEEELLAAYDLRHGRSVQRGRSPWPRYATAAGFLLCLVTATQVTAEYKVEMGKRLQWTLPRGQTPSPGLGERMAQAFVSESSQRVDVQVKLLHRPGGAATLVVDVWGERLVRDEEGLERLRTMPGLEGSAPRVTRLTGRVRDNLWGLVGHSLFRADSPPEERERARQRLMEELRHQEGEGATIEVEVEPEPHPPRMRIKVRKQVPAPGAGAPDERPPPTTALPDAEAEPGRR